MKKLISMILVVSMILCTSVSAYAASDTDSIDAVTKRGIQEQLEEQNALEKLDIHEYIYRI